MVAENGVSAVDSDPKQLFPPMWFPECLYQLVKVLYYSRGRSGGGIAWRLSSRRPAMRFERIRAVVFPSLVLEISTTYFLHTGSIKVNLTKDRHAIGRSDH